MHLNSIVSILDLVSTFAFALVGARGAASKGMDYGGIALISAISSLSGGTLRNLFLGRTPPWLQHPWLFASIILAVLLTILIRKTLPIGRFVLSLDTFGLAVATVSSTNFALALHANWVSASVLGLIGGVTGGLFRDVLCQVEPVLLHRETIGTSCLAGAITYVGLHQLHVATFFLVIASGMMTITVRELSVRFDWHLPKLR